MDKFNQIIFWCEFPNKVNSKTIKLIDFDTEVYITAKTVKEYKQLSKRFKNKHIKIGLWPILSFEAGYWFSKYTKKEDIDKLKEFDGINMKIDIETPIPTKSFLFKKFSLYSLIRDANKELKNHKYDNKEYLLNVINSLKSKKIIISGFPFPNFISKGYGDDSTQFNKNFYRNHFLYTTFFQNKLLKKIIKFYYSIFVKHKLKKYPLDKIYFAIGCTGSGVFSTEPTYKNVQEFEKELDDFLKWGVKNLVVFNLEGILNRKNPGYWLKSLKERLQ